MLSGAEVYQGLSAAWKLMTGKPEGLRLLDLSADGFWNSFFAIVVALPALVLGWVAIANEMETTGFGAKLGAMVRLAMVDLGAWVLPLCGLALVARRAGIAQRFVHYVVATNWASAIIVWIMLPPALLRLVAPGTTDDFASLLSLALFGLTMVLVWRLTNAVIAMGAAVGTAVFAGMFFASLAVLLALQSLLGLSAPA
jgi:hypothetical protein